MSTEHELHLAVALDGAGWHPAAWREADAQPSRLFAPDYWVAQVRNAEQGLSDFVTIEDSLAALPILRGELQTGTEHVRGRLDAVLVACRVAPVTESVGLIPSVTTTHTEPFHSSKAVATLDFVSLGRAGLQARVSPTAVEAAQFGRRVIPPFDRSSSAGLSPPPPVVELFDEAADFIEVVRRLWDSWEDGAEIRDATTGRFIDRDKLHYIDFTGPFFTVKGPSITPRPPQGQPPVAVLAHVPVAFRLAALQADIVFVTPESTDDLQRLVATVRDHERQVHREGEPLLIVADLVVFVDSAGETARDRHARLDALWGRPARSDALIFAGTPQELADLLVEWHGAGIDGFRLRPGAIPHDLDAITEQLVPLLQKRLGFRSRYAESDLRQRLGLPRPANRFATAGASR